MLQREDYQRFEHLANSQTVIQARKSEQAPGPWIKYAILAWKNGGTVRADVNSGGVKRVYWGSDYAVVSIETPDGETLYPTPPPGAWSYVLIAILPLLGLFIPSGAVRGLGWVGSGFAQPVK